MNLGYSIQQEITLTCISSGFIMNSELSFSRLFQKIVGEKHIIFPEKGSENYIIFPENQWNKRRDIETNVSITIRAGIKQSPKQEDAGLVLYQNWRNNILHLNTGIAGG